MPEPMHKLEGAAASQHLADGHNVDGLSNHMALIVHRRLPNHRHRERPFVLETSAGAEALTRGRLRELHAIDNENTGEPMDRRDVLTRRCISAIHGRLFPEHLGEDPLASV
jgi:hypothetical protein